MQKYKAPEVELGFTAEEWTKQEEDKEEEEKSEVKKEYKRSGLLEMIQAEARHLAQDKYESRK